MMGSNFGGRVGGRNKAKAKASCEGGPANRIIVEALAGYKIELYCF